MRILLAVLAAWALLGSAAAPGLCSVVLVSQDRSVTAAAFAEGPEGTQDDFDSDAAPDFEFFGTGVSAEAMVVGAEGQAWAGQNSQISTTGVTAQGTISIIGQSSLPDAVGSGTASSHFEVTFEVTEPVGYLLSGLLIATGAGSTTLELSDGSGVIAGFVSPPDGDIPVGSSGDLAPGLHTLVVETGGSAIGFGGESAAGTGLYEIGLSMTTVSVPGDLPRTPPSLRVTPNPARDLATLIAVGSGDDVAGVSVFDASGRRVMGWSSFDEGSRLSWDTRDESGRLVPSGVYYVQIDGPTSVPRRRLVVLR